MKKLLFRICLLLVMLTMLVSLTACSGLFGDDGEKGKNVDAFGFERPRNCWITDVLLLNDNETLDDMFGTGGDSGLLSNKAMLADGKDLSPDGQNMLVCMIYGDLGSYELNLETYFKFAMVSGTQVLYDEECVRMGDPYISTQTGYGLDIDIDMSMTPDGRLTITKDFYSDQQDEESVIQAFVVIPFYPLKEGTLYADLRIDCVNMSTSEHSYVDRYATAEIGESAAASTQVAVNSFSAKYLTEQAYNNGTYSDGDMTSEPSFKDGATSYMVMDFEFSAVNENDGGKSVNIMVRVPEAEVMDATIEEAPTGKIEESVVDNTTSIYASYSVPPTAGEAKSVRMVVRLRPLNEGVANVDVFLVGGEGVKTAGKNYISTKLVSGVPTLRYTLSKDKTYYTATALWHADISEVVVPDTYLGLPVKGISSKLLKGNTKMTSLVIGNNVTSLSANDFQNCTSLTTVTFGNGMTQLPNALFKDCTSLKTVTLAAGTKSIPTEFFSGCSALVTVKNIDNVTSIGNAAFERCSSLKALTCGAVDSIGSSAFAGCSSLKTLTCGEITSLGSSAFKGCTSLTAVNTLRVTTIPTGAFENCTSLQWFDLAGVQRIDQRAFYNCKAFTQIMIPDSCTRIIENAFTGTSGVKSLYLGANVEVEHPSYWGKIFDLTALESITVSSEHERYVSDGNCLVYRYTSATDGTTQLATVYLGCKNSTIPDYVNYINDSAFKGCTGLTSITLPASLISIDRYAFQNCTGLTQITIPASVTIIWDHAFEGCTSLKSVKMPSGTWYSANSNNQQAKKETIRVSSAETAAEILTSTHVDKCITSAKYYN